MPGVPGMTTVVGQVLHTGVHGTMCGGLGAAYAIARVRGKQDSFGGAATLVQIAAGLA